MGGRLKKSCGARPIQPFGTPTGRGLSRSSDLENAEVVKRIFELYASGTCSLAELRQIIRTETEKVIAKSHIHDGILRNPFYLGFFTWDGEQHKGSQPSIISHALFQRVQDVLDGHNKPKYQKHKFAFGGLLNPAEQGQLLKKGAFELPPRWRKSLSYLYKALRHDL